MLKRSVCVAALVSLMVIMSVAVYARPLQNETQKGGLFHSYMSIEADTSALDNPLPLFSSTLIPLNISYWHDIPAKFDKPPAPMVKRLIVFGTFVPQQTIHLEIEDKPDWATISLSTPDIIIDVPSEQGMSHATHAKVDLSISPLREAPSEPTAITIVASCDKLGLLGGVVYRYTLVFTPNFIASIGVEAPSKIDVSPHQTTEIEIKVKNMCNRNIEVNTDLSDIPQRWNPSIQPSFTELGPHETAIFHFSIVGPFEFGWHEELASLPIYFKVTPKPELSSESVEPETFVSYITVQNVGFYMPLPLIALVVIVVIALIAVVAVYIKKMSMTKQ
ncbi:MAG TPA: hypothetical protein ENG74_03790 [Thermoplasmatales archaeon]|nr:hypothetical protein [Thermoplasmatales archaeon]